ncbi:hypothetical protein FE257_010607 [Aspergillus nanangensis]|uniref:Transmembrane protein n=1 Tax=Aspergillus nanangensis TaxID=2582783 RepID=A0AAD4GRX0_ASPNN|nr:hypothetical protein FE257_010607 [Aspergillus nanangensis]
MDTLLLKTHYYVVIGTLIAQSLAQDPSEDPEAQNKAGAEGPSSEGVGFSNKGMIALCTIVGVVVVIGISSAVLFVVAKKRQWKMRETLRRSARQVTQAIKTPLTPRFPRSQVAPKGEERTKRREEGLKRQRTMDLEKNALVEKASVKGEDTQSRGWGTYFSFGRG